MLDLRRYLRRVPGGISDDVVAEICGTLSPSAWLSNQQRRRSCRRTAGWRHRELGRDMDRARGREPGRRVVETFEGVLRNPQLRNDAELDSVVPGWRNTSHRGSGVARAEADAPLHLGRRDANYITPEAMSTPLENGLPTDSNERCPTVHTTLAKPGSTGEPGGRCSTLSRQGEARPTLSVNEHPAAWTFADQPLPRFIFGIVSVRSARQ